MDNDTNSVLLDVDNLQTHFHTDGGIVKAVDGVSFYVKEQEIVGVVGESGSGKSVTQLSVMQLIPTPPGEVLGGDVHFEGQNVLDFEANGYDMRQIRGGKIAMIFQEPMTSLNPVMTISRQLTEMLELHLGMGMKAARKRAIELLTLAGIPAAEKRIDDYPHQFSGGMRQRVMIAMALSCNPRLLIADEPTTALDVTTQAQVLDLMQEMVKEFNASLVIVTHNLGVVARYAQRIYVMYAGRVVEEGLTKEIFANPQHPYTRGLLNAVPRLDDKHSKLVPIAGLPPGLIDLPDRCPFLPRCSHRLDICYKQPRPKLRQIDGQHGVACHIDLEPWQMGGKSAEIIPTSSIDIKSHTKKNLQDEIILEVKNLEMYFPITKGLLRRKVAEVKAVDGISFKLRKGETLGLVGESGCGKTTTGRCVVQLDRPTGGQIIFQGTDMCALPERKLKSLRREMSLIFQDPNGSLDPRQTAGSIIGEPLLIHKLVSGRAAYDARVEELMQLVGLNPNLKNRVPHEFSGGQRQRLAIARALASDPALIVCDEPVSALDVSIQAQIINLLQELQEGLDGLSYLFVSHDLSVVRHISDRVGVMYLGRIVEIADAASLYDNPLHPYTQVLLSAIPIPDPFVEETRTRMMLHGEVPSPLNPPTGCSFHPRCPVAIDRCKHDVPELIEIDDGHAIACHVVSDAAALTNITVKDSFQLLN
ncbi:MAG: dipeptide ABC transporter ATP-binding protein [Anaerolineae bacterium]